MKNVCIPKLLSLENTMMVKRCFIIGICLFVVATGLQAEAAETMYIRTIVKITLRSGPGIDHKIKTMVSSGTEVTVLELGDEWSKIRTSKGSEGWVLTQLLTVDKPQEYVPVTSDLDTAALVAERDAFSKANKRLMAENKRLISELSDSNGKITTLNQSYDILKEESADYLKIKSDYNKVMAKLSEQKGIVKQYEDTITDLKLQQNILWFLVGAGVLILGFIIGYNAKRERRRPSLL